MHSVHPFAPPIFPPLPVPQPSPGQFADGSVAMGRLGPIVAVRGGWGTPIDNPTMIQHYITHGYDPAAAQAAIETTGFTSGYYFPADNDVLSDETQAWHVDYVVQFVEMICAERGWDGIDILVVGSCSSRNTIHLDVQAVLCQRGIKVDSARLYGQACNAALSAMDDILRDDSLHGARVIAVGLETFSGGRIEHENPITIRTFSNGGGAVGFIAGEEIDFITGRSVVEFDRRGVVAGAEVCELPPAEQRIAAPTWHEIVDDYTADKLFSTPNGDLFMQLPHTDDAVLRSDGMATVAYFARRMPSILLDVYATYHNEFADEFGPLAAHTFSHQPSLPVIGFLNTEVVRTYLQSIGLPTKQARKLSRLAPDARDHALTELGLTLPTLPSIDWYMPRTGFNNCSAGTPMVILVQMMRDGLLQPGRPTGMFAFGVGSVIAASIWRFLPS